MSSAFFSVKRLDSRFQAETLKKVSRGGGFARGTGLCAEAQATFAPRHPADCTSVLDLRRPSAIAQARRAASKVAWTLVQRPWPYARRQRAGTEHQRASLGRSPSYFPTGPQTPLGNALAAETPFRAGGASSDGSARVRCSRRAHDDGAISSATARSRRKSRRRGRGRAIWCRAGCGGR